MARTKKPKSPAVKIDARKAQEVWKKLSQEDWETLLSPADGYQRKGEHHKVRCWGGHPDEHPSMTITPHREKGGIAHCFSCGTTAMNPVLLLSQVRKEKPADTAKLLRQKYGLKVLTAAIAEQLEKEAKRADLKLTIIKLCCALLKEAVMCGLDDEALQRAQLYWAKPALAYLASRTLGGVSLDVSLWSVICDSQLVGILPPLADVQGRLGADSEGFKFFSGYFDQYLSEGHRHVGNLVLPWHTAPGEVGRVKLRSPVIGSKDIVTVTETDDELPHPGLYGLHHYRIYLNISGEHYVKTAHIVEGEFDALQSISHMIQNTNDSFVVIAAGGGAAPTLDPLARLGIEDVRVVQDNDEGGVKFVGQLAGKNTGDGVSISVFQWLEETSVKDPDEAVKALGYPTWSKMMVDDDRFDPLIRWLVERVIEEIEKDRVSHDDKKHISGIAKEWGALLHDRQELRAFAREVAERYGLDPVILDRDLRRADESEDEFIDELKVSLLEHHTPIGCDGRAIKMLHKATQQTYYLPLDDPRGQAQALASFHGTIADLVRETTGFPAFLALENEESSVSFIVMCMKCREYVNAAISRIARGLPSLEYATTLAQGIHCLDNDITYVVNGRSVWKLRHRDASIEVAKLDAPVDGERVFNTEGPAWFPGVSARPSPSDVGRGDRGEWGQ